MQNATAAAVRDRHRLSAFGRRLLGVTGCQTGQDWFQVMVMLAANPWSAFVAEASSMAVKV
jgi:hypothetical protein